jgi:hypothetical protein
VKSRTSPQLLSHQRKRIGKGRMSLAVPSYLPESIGRPSRHMVMRKQSDQREQTQESRCGSAYRQIRPLPLLGLEPEMSACLLEGHFQLPAHHKQTDDLLGVSFKVGTQESLGFELSLRVSEKDPA